MGEIKKIQDRRIPLYAKPFRFAYRMIRKLLSDEVRLKQVEMMGLKFLVWANEDIGKKMILLRSYELNETKALKNLVRPGDVCIDVGGNIGYYSVNLARMCGSGGHVYAFEPIRKNSLVIELSALLNGLENISVNQIALSNGEGEIELSVPSGDGAYAHISPEGSDREVGGYKGHASTLDAFLKSRSIAGADIIKIDVEGAEKLVLEGARATLSGIENKPRVIMVELADDYLRRFGSSIDDVVSYMNTFGYVPYYSASGGALVEFTRDEHNKIYNVFFLNESDKR